MPGDRTRWGVLLFVLAVLLTASCVYLVIRFPSSRLPSLYETFLPAFGTALSLIALFLGHISYPRVQNLKVYLTGYLTGCIGIGYFVFLGYLGRYENALTALYLILFLNFILVSTVPSFAKYRVTKIITFSVVGVEIVLMAVTRYVPEAVAWASCVTRDSLFRPWAWGGVVLFAATFGLSIYRMRREFHFGGVVAGAAFVYLAAWLAPTFMAMGRDRDLEIVLFALAPAYIEIGLLVHWFSRLEHRDAYDPLLHIYNRNYCSRIISEQSNISTVPPFGVAMIDIDHFKKVNDTHGHQAGDQVLHSVAQAILREVVPDGIACRYGGEEIAVFFPKKEAKEVTELMEQVRAAVERTKVATRKKKLSVTVSIGVSHRADVSQTIIDVIHAADKALYRAKGNGRNQVKAGKASMPKAKKK